MIVEVCANSFDSAINAETAGAQRIELCAELAVGGVTPSYGCIKKVVDAISIPVHILVRARSGDFTYTKNEFQIMKEDILMSKNLGCSGIVSGVLNNDQTIDIERTKELIELAYPLNFTFHRAFDWVPDAATALRQLIEIKAKRVLTSGQCASAVQGVELLKTLNAQANGDIVIMPGGGIKPNNASIFKEAGFSEVHVSASVIKTVIEQPKVPMNSQKFFDETIRSQSSSDIIKSIVGQLND